jgi:hypothetical protein
LLVVVVLLVCLFDIGPDTIEKLLAVFDPIGAM